MRIKRFTLPALCAMSLAAAGGWGTENDGPIPEPDTLMSEIEFVLALQDSVVSELRVKLERAPTEREALVLLRQIDRCKKDSELAVLRIQHEYARQTGDDESLVRIEQAISVFARPVPAKPNPVVEAARRNRETGGPGHE